MYNQKLHHVEYYDRKLKHKFCKYFDQYFEQMNGILNTSWSLRFFHHQTVAKPLSSTLNSFRRLKRWIQMNWDILKGGKQTLMTFYLKSLILYLR